MRRNQQFVYGQVSWMLATLLGLVALGALSVELFFIGSLLGFLVLFELYSPRNVAPKWRSRLKWFIVLGLLLFVYVMARRVLRSLPEGAL